MAALHANSTLHVAHCAGTYVTVHIAGVPADKAAALLQRVQGAQQQCQPPLVVFGLLQHESKMSVMNMGVSACLRLGYCSALAHATRGLLPLAILHLRLGCSHHTSMCWRFLFWHPVPCLLPM